MKALITGATGFIGSHLAERLSKTGCEISCIVRKTSNLKWLEGLDLKFLEGDCADKDFLNRSVRGFDYIFHLAGLTKTSCRKDFYSINAKYTENIIEAVREHNPEIKRFVYLSSLSAFGPKVNSIMPTEAGMPNPVSDYGKSKLEGEKAVLKYSDSVPVSILRPAAVYGPRDKDFFVLFKLIKNGFLPYQGDGKISLVYIDDLIDAIILSAEKEDNTGKIYFISDGMLYSNNEVINEIASALNVKVFRLKTPNVILKLIGFFSEKISKITGSTTIITSDKIKELSYSEWVCDISRAKSDLCFNPKIGLKEGMKWTADWYQIHKWL
jgi:nucleoside-diphosphate-sugar epimerase